MVLILRYIESLWLLIFVNDEDVLGLLKMI